MGHNDIPFFCTLSHDEVVFIKWDIEMEGAQRGGLSILLWLVRTRKAYNQFRRRESKGSARTSL